MNITFAELALKKRYPLRISRGEITGSINLIVSIQSGDNIGIGEAAPSECTGSSTATECRQQIERFLNEVDISNLSPLEGWLAARHAGVAPCAWAAVDIAHWDLLAKIAAMPLYRMLGLSGSMVPTSVTIGILSPEVVRERIPEILQRTGARFLKVKLGSADGIEADQEMFNTVLETVKGTGIGLRVDANGGWSLDQAKRMMSWLSQRNTEYIEQPLSDQCDDQLPELFRDRALPIYIDESCNFKTDVVRLAHCVDGVNLKLMKCGGITEALAIVSTARAHNLKTMIGCMGESSISISAGAAIGALFDHIDLDSHLNLLPDPALGAIMTDGVVRPTDQPGHGGQLVQQDQLGIP